MCNDIERINHNKKVLKLIKGKIEEDSESSPIKTKTKYYKKLLNFYNKVGHENRKRSSSPINKGIYVSKAFLYFNFEIDIEIS
jgi:hypothetical protein